MNRYVSPSCRAFVIDTPWSATFVSWVMRRAQVPGFNGSASHVNYVRAAYRDPSGNAYQVANHASPRPPPARKGGVWGKRGSARGVPGGCRKIKKKTKYK